MGRHKKEKLDNNLSPKVKFEVDYNVVFDWANQITYIRNKLEEGKYFEAGFDLCYMREELFKCYDLLVKGKNTCTNSTT